MTIRLGYRVSYRDTFLSGGRPIGTDLLAENWLPQEPPTRTSPELRLCAAVLERAMDDVAYPPKRSDLERQPSMDAGAWFIAADGDWPFSFLNVCETLKLDATAVREHVFRRQRRLGADGL